MHMLHAPKSAAMKIFQAFPHGKNVRWLLLIIKVANVLTFFATEVHPFTIGTAVWRNHFSSKMSSVAKGTITSTIDIPSTTALSMRKQFATFEANNAGMISDRREWLQKQAILSFLGASMTGFVVAPTRVVAAENDDDDEINPDRVSRMGGQLEKFQDTSRGFRMLAPSGWNKFEGEVGAYDVMWRDLVDTRENIKISTIPVKSTTTSVALLGDVQALGEQLAAKRNASLVKAVSRSTDGILFYNFEFAIKDGTHQMLQMCVGKGKLWSLDLNSSEKRWEKKKEMYKNVANSFMPKLG